VGCCTAGFPIEEEAANRVLGGEEKSYTYLLFSLVDTLLEDPHQQECCRVVAQGRNVAG